MSTDLSTQDILSIRRSLALLGAQKEDLPAYMQGDFEMLQRMSRQTLSEYSTDDVEAVREAVEEVEGMLDDTSGSL